MPVYDSYKNALANTHSYEDPGVIQVVSKKTAVYRNALLAVKDSVITDRQTLQNLFVLTKLRAASPLEVLEIGGACGASFYELDHHLPSRIKHWHILETPAMSAVGRKHFQDTKLTFHDDLHKAVRQLENLDLLIAQDVLQYFENPLQALENWLNLDFENVYITRTVVGANIDHPIITKQVVNLSAHGPGAFPKECKNRRTSQPLTIVPYDAVISRIISSHSILYSFAESEIAPMRIGSQSVQTRKVGFILRKGYCED